MTLSSPSIPGAGVDCVGSVDRNTIIGAYAKIGVNVSDWINADAAIMRCKASGYRFYYPFSLAGSGHFYEVLMASRQYYGKWRWEHQIALEYLENMGSIGSVFEVGCGPGHFLEKVAAAKKYGSDFNRSAVQELSKTAGIREVDPADFNATLPDGAIDVTCMFQVLEHFPNVTEVLTKLNKIAKPGGLLIVGVPNNNPFLYRWDIHHALNMPPHHMALWGRRSLTRVLKAHGFDIEVLATEPLVEQEYWMKINVRHYVGNAAGDWFMRRIYRPNSKRLNRIIGRFEGRNLLAICRKSRECG